MPYRSLAAVLWIIAAAAGVFAEPVGTAFTYQGVLTDAGVPLDGPQDLRFTLHDAVTGGSILAGPVEAGDVPVEDGRFSTEVDLGDVFDGTATWLEVAVRPGASTGTYTVLSPRQPITATPAARHAEHAGTATSAGDAARLGGRPASYYLEWANLSGVPRGLDDGDDDTLSALRCARGDIARWSGAAWNCSADDDVPFASTYVIGPVGTPEENGLALLAAYQAIPPPPDGNGSVVVKLEAGTYQLPAGVALPLMSWVTLEGSGQSRLLSHSTTISGTRCGSGHSDSAFLLGATGATIANLAVVNRCSDPASDQAAIFNAADHFALRDLHVMATGAAARNTAIANTANSFLVDRVRATAVGASVSNHGLHSDGLHTRVRDSQVRALGTSGTALAVGLYNGSCGLTIEGSSIEGWTATTSYGISGTGCAARLDNVVVSGEDAAISFTDPGGLEVIRTEAAAVDGVGIVLTVPTSSTITGQRATLRGVRATGMTRALDVLVYAQDLRVRVDGSELRGVAGPVRALDADVLIGASLLENGPILLQGTATATCAGVWDEDYVHFASACP